VESVGRGRETKIEENNMDPTEIVTNEQGGKQSKIEGKPTEFPPMAFLEVAKVMGIGSERYPRGKTALQTGTRSDAFPIWIMG